MSKQGWLTTSFSHSDDLLFDLNMEILHILLKMLDLNVPISFSDEYIKDVNTDFDDMRDLMHPKRSFQVDPAFSPVAYNQVFSNKYDFIPNLSIIDLIFNKGPDASEILKKSILSY